MSFHRPPYLASPFSSISHLSLLGTTFPLPLPRSTSCCDLTQAVCRNCSLAKWTRDKLGSFKFRLFQSVQCEAEGRTPQRQHQLQPLLLTLRHP